MTDTGISLSSDRAPPLEIRGGLGSLFRFHQVLAPASATLQDAQHPKFFMHVANFLAPNDHVLVQHEAGAWFVHMLVRNVLPNRDVHTVLLNHFAEPPPRVASAGGMNLEYRGEKHRWSIVIGEAGAGGEIVRDGFPSAGEASDVLAAMAAKLVKPGKS